jgi:hypothetical protein
MPARAGEQFDVLANARMDFASRRSMFRETIALGN